VQAVGQRAYCFADTLASLRERFASIVLSFGVVAGLFSLQPHRLTGANKKAIRLLFVSLCGFCDLAAST
jgi:hypothetical protein